MFVDYLGFGYRYNLMVDDNSQGFEWKPISVCTESMVLFDKHKIIQYLNLYELYYKYEIGVNIKVLEEYNQLRSYIDQYLNLSAIYPTYKNRGDIEEYFNGSSGFNQRNEFHKMEKISKFFVSFVDRIFNEINFVEMSSMIVNENDLFECSAKFHYNNGSIDSFAMEIENCFEYFSIKTTVMANDIFGICYELFENNPLIFLKDDDSIKLIIKIQEQRDFIINYSKNNYLTYRLHQYFQWYYFINDLQSIASKSSLITSTRIGLSAELKISKTSIVMLSVPYMTYCKNFHCHYDFYKITLDNDFYNYNNNSVIEFKRSMKKQLIYHAEPSLEFVDFISNIGGLFGLYFGLSFIDISDILKSITRTFKNHLERIIFYRKIKTFIQYFKLSHVKILEYIKLITKTPWKIILTIISSPFFVSQMFNMIINYFQYSTQISFQFVEYQQKNQKISINEFPAITVCTEHMLEKAFFDQYYIHFNKQKLLIINCGMSHRDDIDGAFCEINSDMFRQYYNLTTSNINILSFIINHCGYNFENFGLFQFLSKYFDINTEEEYHRVISRIEDKHKYGLNGTLDLLDFYVNHYNCWALFEPNKKCEDLKPTIKILSPFGKCQTYLMGDYNNNDDDIYIDKIAIYTSEGQGELRTYLKRKFILHSRNHLPIWTSNHFRATDVSLEQEFNSVVKIEKIQFAKLPAPYDKNCLDYSEKEQFECMDKCIEKYYKHELKCFPNINNYHTILVDDQIFKKNFSFCNNSEYISEKNKLFIKTCNSICSTPCSKTYFNEEVNPSSMYAGFQMETVDTRKDSLGRAINFIYNNVDYLKIIWLPKFTIIILFIKIVNIWSLWHGIHFKLLIDIILEYIKRVNSYFLRKIVVNIDWKNYINFEITKVSIS